MTLSVGQSIAIIAVCAACTFLERWLPWLLFGRRAVPKVVEYLGRILPMAVMVSLLVYCLRGMQFTSAGAWVPQVIAVGVTAGLHWWRRSTLLSIAAGAMIFITVEELIPESQAEGHGHGATYGFLLGFWLMALLGILGG